MNSDKIPTYIRIILALFFTCFLHSVHTTEKYPGDICFMVADLKYNSTQGVKICEIQHASLSMFNGDIFRSEEEESIHKEFLRILSLYNEHGWVVSNSVSDKNLVSTLTSSAFWQSPNDIITLLSDPNFMHQAKQPADDIYDLSSYQGFLYINWSQLGVIADFEERFPGMIVIDKSSFPLWIDKYKMTQLFAEDPLLATFKPKWGSYKKIYTKELAEEIASDLQCTTFVIKPRGEFLGNGVIIIPREELDEVLFYVITKSGKLAESTDPSYAAWKQDPYDSFIVEEFVTSDPLMVPHLENKVYQPTMRVAFVLAYNNHCHQVHFLGGYWKTPALSLDDEGDLLHKNKDICKPPYYCAVEAETMQAVQDELRIALPLLHSKMLEFYASSPKTGYTPAKKRKFELVLQEQPIPSL
ncbi:MAG: hypothetical protein JSR46_12360 [Verrucomicrobia bacterium]|nr:hypothetical protein [Verrucomicrobiota bacterium]